MAVGTIYRKNKSQADMDRYGAQLQDMVNRMPHSEMNEGYKQHLMRNRPWYENAYKAIGKGTLKAAESTINFAPDMAGREERWATFSDYVEDNPESTLFQIIEDLSQLGTGLLMGGPIIKGTKSTLGFGVKELRKRQLKASGRRGGKARTAHQAWNIAKQGAFRGGIAELLAFRGQDEQLLTSSFFEDNPEWKAAYDEVTQRDDFGSLSTEEAGSIFAKNLKGRLGFAVEGALLGAAANFLMAGAGAAWRVATGETDKMLRKATRGKDKMGAAGADATEEASEGVTSDVLTQQEREAHAQLSKSKDTLIDAELSAREAAENGKPNNLSDVEQRDTNIVPDVADEGLVSDATTARGVNPNVYVKPPASRTTPFKVVEGLTFKEGVRTVFEENTIKFNKPLIQREFKLSTQDLDKFTGDNRFNASDIFDTVDDYQKYLIEKERARQYFPQLKKETDKAYQQRLELHAVNEAKRKGLGHFYKYEFDAPAKLKHLKLSERDSALLFNEGQAAGGKKLVQMLKGEIKGSTPQAILKQAEHVLRLDTVYSDQGMRYFQGRFMSFFMHHYGQNIAKQTDADALAKAVGFLHDTKGMTPADILEEHLFDSLDDFADGTGLKPRHVLHRLIKGRGSHKRFYHNLSADEVLDHSRQMDVNVAKELNVRIMAYRMEQAIGMKRYRQLSKQIADTDIKVLQTTKEGKALVNNYLVEMEKQAAKIENMQKLRRSSGRILRAWRDFNDSAMTGIEAGQLLNARGGLNNIKKHAQRADAIFDGADNGLDGAAAASDHLTKTTNWIDVHNEYWLNSILSGTKTQVVNLLSTGLHMYYKPLEGLLGGIRDPQTRKAFTKSLVETAMINAQVTRVIGKLGLNKIKKISRVIDENKYLSNREDIFKGGSGKTTDTYQQALGAVAGARKALRTGEGTLTKGSDLFDVTPPKAISRDLLSEGATETAKDFMDFAGNIIRLPSRLMIGSDELFKQISFRASAMGRLASDAYEVALEQGIKPKNISSDYIADYVGTHFHGLIRASGARYSNTAIREEAIAAHQKMAESAQKNMQPFEITQEDFIDQYRKQHQRGQLEEVSKYAMDYAEDVTFTRSLDADLKELQEHGLVKKGKRSWLQDTQDMVHAHPWMRLLMPFIRTPVNLLKWPLQRLPTAGTDIQWLKNLNQRYQADMASNDPLRKAQAKGRVAAGRFYWFGFAAAAHTGTITGGGPSNPRERRNLMATGWRPYSVRVGDKYISYSRLDPFASVMGLAADLYEKTAELGRDGDIEDSWLQAIMLGGAYSISNNIADKSYLAGINNVLQALIDPEHEFAGLVKRQGTAYIPKIISQWTPITDDAYVKKTYGLLEGITSKVPFANQFIEPMRNYLGEPLEAMYAPTVWASGFSPFLISKAKNDPVLEELASLGYGFGAPSPRIKGSKYLDMRRYYDKKTGRSAFDRYQELIGETKTSGGMTLRDALKKLYKTKHYERASLLAQRGALQFEGTYRDPRIKSIKSIMAKFRASAKAQTLKEFPDLMNATRAFDATVKNQILDLIRT